MIWAKGDSYFQSFQLEFVLMPIRIATSYISLYYLIPTFLAKEREVQFLLRYLLIVIIAGVVQRFLTYFFHDFFFAERQRVLEIPAFVKSIVLVNTTAMLLTSLKIYKEWRALKRSKEVQNEKYLEIRSDKRFHRVLPSEISYVEGLGNYVTISLRGGKSLISYMTLKEAESLLQGNFQRVHKSFIVNGNHVTSFNNENVEIDQRIIPIGKSYDFS